MKTLFTIVTAICALGPPGVAGAQVQMTASQSGGFVTVSWSGSYASEDVSLTIWDAAGREWAYQLPASAGTWTSGRKFFPGAYGVNVTAEDCGDGSAWCEAETRVAVPNKRPRMGLIGVRARRNYWNATTTVRVRFRICDDSRRVKIRGIERYRYVEDAPATVTSASRWFAHRRSTADSECFAYVFTTTVYWIGRRFTDYYTVTLRTRDSNGAVSLPLRVNIKPKL